MLRVLVFGRPSRIARGAAGAPATPGPGPSAAARKPPMAMGVFEAMGPLGTPLGIPFTYGVDWKPGPFPWYLPPPGPPPKAGVLE